MANTEIITFTKESIDKAMAVIAEMPYKYAQSLLTILRAGVVQPEVETEEKPSEEAASNTPVDISN